MSKQLPYFKFYSSEWISGDITLESMELQGVFINVCSIYWAKECRVAMAGLKQRYGEAIATLINSGLIKEKRGFAVINFLDEQWNEFDHNHQKNSKNGKKGAEKRWGKNSPPIALREEEIRGKERKEDKIREEKTLVLPFSSIDFSQVWEVLLKEKKWRKKSFSALQASLQKLSVVSEQDAIQMIKNTIAGEWQGFFELEKNKNKHNGKHRQPLTDEGLANAWAEDIAKTAAKHT